MIFWSCLNRDNLGRLKELLRRKLEESGWTARVKQQCERKPPEKPFEPKFIDYIEEAKNLNADTLSPQDIADRVAPVARAAVPERVQQEMLVEIKRFLDNNIWINFCMYL